MRQPGEMSESELEIDSSSFSDHKAAFLPALHIGGSLCRSCSAQHGGGGAEVGSWVIAAICAVCSGSSPSGSTWGAALCLLLACSG